MDSDDQVSVCSEVSVPSKCSSYDDHESSTCDSIIMTFSNVKVEDFEKNPLSPVTEEIEEIDLTNDDEVVVTELSLVQISSEGDSDNTMESTTTSACNKSEDNEDNKEDEDYNNEEPKTKDNSTNTENYGYKRWAYRPGNGRYFQNRPYGYNYNHPYQHNNYYRSNYYQRPMYNSYQQKQFSYTNYYQMCRRWDCQMKHRQNEEFRYMLFRGIFHFTKFLEYISQTNV